MSPAIPFSCDTSTRRLAPSSRSRSESTIHAFTCDLRRTCSQNPDSRVIKVSWVHVIRMGCGSMRWWQFLQTAVWMLVSNCGVRQTGAIVPGVSTMGCGLEPRHGLRLLRTVSVQMFGTKRPMTIAAHGGSLVCLAEGSLNSRAPETWPRRHGPVTWPRRHGPVTWPGDLAR